MAGRWATSPQHRRPSTNWRRLLAPARTPNSATSSGGSRSPSRDHTHRRSTASNPDQIAPEAPPRTALIANAPEAPPRATPTANAPEAPPRAARPDAPTGLLRSSPAATAERDPTAPAAFDPAGRSPTRAQAPRSLAVSLRIGVLWIGPFGVWAWAEKARIYARSTRVIIL